MSLSVDGRIVDDLSLAAIDLLERETGRMWHELPASVSGLAAIARAVVGEAAAGLPFSAVTSIEDDRPTMFRDGMPTEGGRTADRFISMFGKPPWCWPPDVVLRQSLRNLLVICDSLDEG